MRALLVVLMLAGSSACRITRPFDLDQDVVALGVLLVAGEGEARMLAIHPHREQDEAAPRITAELAGSGWTAAFSDSLQLEACTTAEELPGPASCLRAVLPEAILPGSEYGLRGRAPLGTFAGRIAVPAPPLLIRPPDTLEVPLPDDFDVFGLAIQHEVGVDVGTLLLEVLDVFETQDDGTETEIPVSRLGSFPKAIELREDNAITIRHGGKPLRFSLRLHGIGWRYTTFVKHRGRNDPLVRPWPNFGIEGEGAYGYFDGVAASGLAHIIAW